MTRRSAGHSGSRRTASVASLSAEVRRLRASLDNCTSEIERLSKEIDINVKRMGAMQNEIDQLRNAIRDPHR